MKNFKDRHFVIKPRTQAADMPLFDTVEYKEEWEVKNGLACKFPWSV